MRRFLLLLCISVMSAGIALAQKTPPGGDTGGSDRPISRSDQRTEPAVSPDVNQQITDTAGSSSGYEGRPAYAGSSSYGTATAVRSNGRNPAAEQTSATDARRQSSKLSRGKRSKRRTQQPKANAPH